MVWCGCVGEKKRGLNGVKKKPSREGNKPSSVWVVFIMLILLFLFLSLSLCLSFGLIKQFINGLRVLF